MFCIFWDRYRVIYHPDMRHLMDDNANTQKQLAFKKACVAR